MLLGPFLECIIEGVALWGYPLMQTCRLLNGSAAEEEGKISVNAQYQQWVTYWIIVVVYASVVENMLNMLLGMVGMAVDYIPLYFELKLTLFLWLMAPSFNGAAYLWNDVICARYAALDEKYYEKINALFSSGLLSMRPRDLIHKFMSEEQQQALAKTSKPAAAKSEAAASKPSAEKASEAEKVPVAKKAPEAEEASIESRKLLANKTMRELKKIARDKGVSDDDIESTDEADDTTKAMIDLICTADQALLRKKTMKELKKIARDKGISEGEIDDTEDATDTTQAMLDLICA